MHFNEHNYTDTQNSIDFLIMAFVTKNIVYCTKSQQSVKNYNEILYLYTTYVQKCVEIVTKKIFF